VGQGGVLHPFCGPPKEGVIRSNEQEVEVQKEGRRRGMNSLEYVRQLDCSLWVCELGVDHDTEMPAHHCWLS
jgi:hypothetical protein